MNAEVTGRCLCGAVTFAANPKKLEVGACHCGMCRRWSAGPYLAVENEGEVRFTGEVNIGVYRSSEWAERGFCRVCGSALFWKLQGANHYALSAGALDKTDGLAFVTEVFIDEKPAYYDFANDTRKLTGEESVAEFEAAKNNV